MPFTVEDLQDLLRLLEQQPQWKEAVRAALWSEAEFASWLRERLPRLLQEDPRFGAEVIGVLQQTLSPRSEFVRVLEEIRALREDFGRRFEVIERTLQLHTERFEAMDRRFEVIERTLQLHTERFEAMDRRFEAIERTLQLHTERFEAMDRRFEALEREMDRRFEAVDRRFEAVDRRFEAVDRRFEALQREMDRRFELQARILAEHSRTLRRMEVGLGSLGRRFGKGFEEAVRATIEEFAGVGPLTAERLVIRDVNGELYGVPNQEVEFDAFVHDGRRFLVEVKGFAEPEDVLNFVRKVEFARRHLAEPFEAVLLAPYATKRAVELARELGVRLLMEPEEEAPDEGN
ncbi:MAG: DUF3782 domain-containing protein [Armatimonadota bacterium]|nr:DUF3782 domain-containing protein [Armatimonadota bacterium]MDR7615000.1 DUF3782 domain-containing protein [Armatimonadota bacterium]